MIASGCASLGDVVSCRGIYVDNQRDCDGDIIHLCTYGGKCVFQQNVRDADGDTVVMCRQA